MTASGKIELVGPILDEFGSEVPPIGKKGAGRFEVDAMRLLDQVAERCGMQLPPEPGVDTIGGFVIDLLGHIPTVDEQITVGRHRVTVLDAEPTRVRRMLIAKEPSDG